MPAQLQWRGLEQAAATRGATRGFLGDVLLSAIDVDHRRRRRIRRADFVASAGGAARRRSGRRRRLRAHARVAAAAQGQRLATRAGCRPRPMAGRCWCSCTAPSRPPVARSASCGRSIRSVCARCSTQYGGRVYALDHPTLGVSPIANALTLAQALPEGARLHLVTHSRGGLVAEVLARVCANPMSADDLAILQRRRSTQAQRDAAEGACERRAASAASASSASCASPARRAARCSRPKRLDAYLSVFKWTLELAGIPVAPELVDFLGEVAQRRADPRDDPGPGGADSRQPAGAVAARGRRADPGRPARRGRRHRRRFGHVAG